MKKRIMAVAVTAIFFISTLIGGSVSCSRKGIETSETSGIALSKETTGYDYSRPDAGGPVIESTGAVTDITSEYETDSQQTDTHKIPEKTATGDTVSEPGSTDALTKQSETKTEKETTVNKENSKEDKTPESKTGETVPKTEATTATKNGETKTEPSSPKETTSKTNDALKAFNGDLNEEHSFQLQLLSLGSMSDYVSRGYERINDKKELREYIEKLFKNLPKTKDEKYLVAPYAAFDELAENFLRLDKAETIDERDKYIYGELGLDIQKYMTDGISLLSFYKVEDSQSKDCSTYLIYYYSIVNKDQRDYARNKAGEIASKFMSESEYKKISKAHEWLCRNVKYKYNMNVMHYHSAFSAFYSGEVVCEGYAKAFKMLMDALLIECRIVSNDTHAWNEVKLDGLWYMLDVTNDAMPELSDSDGVCEYYFLLGRDVLTSTSAFSISGYEPFSEDYNFEDYGYLDKSNTSENELAEYTYDHAKRVRLIKKAV